MDTDTVSLPFLTPLFARDPLSFCRRRRHRRRSASLVVISLSLQQLQYLLKRNQEKEGEANKKEEITVGSRGWGEGGKGTMASACGAVAVVSGFQNLRQACILSSPGTLLLFFLTPGELVLNGLLACPPRFLHGCPLYWGFLTD